MSKQTITEFLEARIAEDESRAWSEIGAEYFTDGAWPEECAARVLAECAAKRAIIDVCEGGGPWPSDIDRMLEALAAVYASHADYRQEWSVA